MVFGAVKQPAQPQALYDGPNAGRPSLGKSVYRRCGLNQCLTVFFTLGNRQAIIMRFDPADQDVVAIDDQVMGCNRRAQIVTACTGIIHTILCSDMFHDHA